MSLFKFIIIVLILLIILYTRQYVMKYVMDKIAWIIGLDTWKQVKEASAKGSVHS